jgi:hypothetical protein
MTLCACMNFKYMLEVLISIALHGALFRHMRNFLLGVLSTPGSLFRHTFSKNTLNIKIYAIINIFVS